MGCLIFNPNRVYGMALEIICVAHFPCILGHQGNHPEMVLSCNGPEPLWKWLRWLGVQMDRGKRPHMSWVMGKCTRIWSTVSSLCRHSPHLGSMSGSMEARCCRIGSLPHRAFHQNNLTLGSTSNDHTFCQRKWSPNGVLKRFVYGF